MRHFMRTAKEAILALGLFLAINTTALAGYYIPSESMLPSLLVGDHLIVSKFAYGYSNQSVAGAPDMFEGRILERPAARGDVAVFALADGDARTTYIKRIIGLPGDTIAVRAGVLHINGAPVRRERAADFVRRMPSGRVERTAQYRETLPNGRSYMTLDLHAGGLGDDAGPFAVPPGHYFAMGDNRDNSRDSRWPQAEGLGFIPAEALVGRADVILWSWAGRRDLFRTERTLSRIR